MVMDKSRKTLITQESPKRNTKKGPTNKINQCILSITDRSYQRDWTESTIIDVNQLVKTFGRTTIHEVRIHFGKIYRTYEESSKS